MEAEVHTEPGEASVADGMVILDGPGCTAVTMTPEAASITAERLLGASADARAAQAAGEQ